MVSAFLDMDRRQTIAAAAVDASAELFPERGLGRLWEPVRDQCFQAGSDYLAATERFGNDHVLHQDPNGARLAFQNSVRQLVDAAQGVDAFYNAHRGHLEKATSTMSTIPVLAQQAKTVAQSARNALAATEQRYREYPSVVAASEELETAIAALDSARSRGRAESVRSDAERVREAASALEDAVKQAPDTQRRTEMTVSSVSTRLSAVRTRVDRLDPAYSALLREFNAASSADLVDNSSRSRTHIDQADIDLREAKQSLAAGNPEHALALMAEARSHLADAEACVDAVTNRLSTLREVRADPAKKEREVRFRLKDAQMFAVNQGLVAQWGSVLDAQIARLERASASLTGTHPDYWSYVVQLDSVEAFIGETVEKMRARP
ncbi:chromosome segregation ATPase [Rhodococcus sp. 27YEA15]|uniref:hypothetical protein n=1 Tax=Rhodococcus sp. 27YEA15 TaxID=3156259 RepID=UPI003C7A5073